MAAAHRAFVGKLIGLAFFGRCSSVTRKICGITSPARWITPYRRSHILARDLVFIVQSGVLHHHAAHRHRLAAHAPVSGAAT